MCSAISARTTATGWCVCWMRWPTPRQLLADGKPEEFMTKVALLARPDALPGEGTA